jgi:hypothetical protein
MTQPKDRKVEKYGKKLGKGMSYDSVVWRDGMGTPVGTSAHEDSPVVPYTKRNVSGEKKTRQRDIEKIPERRRIPTGPPPKNMWRDTSYNYKKPKNLLQEAAKKRLKGK